jgi:hypothetical protein
LNLFRLSHDRCCVTDVAEEIRMKPHRVMSLTLLAAGLAVATPALALVPYGGGGGMPQYGGGGNGPTYGEMPQMSPYPGIRNGDGQWIPYPPGMARKISSKKGPNGWTYNLMQGLNGEIYIETEDDNGKDVHIAGRVAMPGGKKTYPVH